MRTSLTLAVQYRFDFFLEGALALFWLAITLIPLLVVYSRRESVAGWSFAEALVVVGLFSVLKAVLDGAITPSLNHVVDGIRKGTLDFILRKPLDALQLIDCVERRLAPSGGSLNKHEKETGEGVVRQECALG